MSLNEGVRTERYGNQAAQFVEIWEPTDAPVGSAVLIHGGYWRDRYNLDLMHPMARHLVGRGWRAINIEYRRLGDHDGIWPEMSTDVLAAVELASIGGFSARDAEPLPAEPLVAIGHSAGGHLALWAATASAGLDAVVALAPVADLEEADRLDLSDGVVRRLLGGDRTTIPEIYQEASPIRVVPLGIPQLIVHGDLDDNVPMAIATAYAKAASTAGDPVELLTPAGVDHFDIIDPGHSVWRPIDAWLDRISS